MRFTKTNLKQFINEVNEKYCSNTKHHFEINAAYGGYGVVLTGKYVNGKFLGLGSGCASVVYGFQPAKKAYFEFCEKLATGEALEMLQRYEQNY